VSSAAQRENDAIMSLRNVVAVLEDRPGRLWSTFSAAVDLADREHARLTLAKTQEPEQRYAWCAPFALGGYLPPEEDPLVHAGRLLAHAAEFVPMEIPVTTMVLGTDTERELRRLLSCGCHDAVVAGESFLRRARKLRRLCTDSGILTLAVQAAAHAEPEARPRPLPVTLSAAL
jgi:hypothetical protein